MSDPRYHRAKSFMVKNLEEYIDQCNEIDCTKLAEDAANEFNIYEDEINYEIPEWVFDLAVEVGEKYAS